MFAFVLHAQKWEVLINIHAFFQDVSDERLKPIIVGTLCINGKGTPSAFIER